MTKFQLEVDYDFDFRLIGISCHARDYRLCWALNNHLEIQLEKVHRENASSGLKKNGIAIESIYSYFDEENHAAYQLLYNKHNNNLLLPEQKLADFLLIIDQLNDEHFENILKKIKEIDIVNTAFVIDVNTLKSKENLIF
jgi:hypothetical protein